MSYRKVIDRVRSLVVRARGCMEWLDEKPGRELLAFRQLRAIAMMLVEATDEKIISFPFVSR